MSRTTDYVLPVARRAMEAGRRCLANHAHRNSPKKYTQPQLFAILTLRQTLGWTYRATAARLSEWSELRAALELTHVPDASTLCYAQRRLLNEKTSPGCLPRAWTTRGDGR